MAGAQAQFMRRKVTFETVVTIFMDNPHQNMPVMLKIFSRRSMAKRSNRGEELGLFRLNFAKAMSHTV
jgi:hypothetical protein